MAFRKYKVEWLLLMSGIVCAVISVFCDIQSVENTTWFSRSGSIMVLVAAIVEYRLSSYVYDDVDTAAQETAKKRASMPQISDNPLVNGIFKSKITSKPQSPKSRSILSLTSHVLIISGTIAWGYGDVLVG
jgi:hypothetical protein